MTSKRARPAARKRAATKSSVLGKDDYDVIVPSSREWADAYFKFREALDRLYASPDAKWANDSAFCRAKGISRAQFSRVMMGDEKPSRSIVSKLIEAVPETYKECERKWVDKRKQVIIEAEDLADDIWGRIAENLPGAVYVLTTRKLEHDSQALPEAAARFLKAHRANRITFILGNVQEDFDTRYPADGTANSEKGCCWPVSDKGDVGAYIDAILLATGEGEKARKYADQLRCLCVSFLDLPTYQGQAGSRLAELLAFQLLSPTQIWMLFISANGSLFAIVYSRFGESYRWNRVTFRESQHLLQYVRSVVDLHSAAPSLVREWPIETLSTCIKDLRVVLSDNRSGGRS